MMRSATYLNQKIPKFWMWENWGISGLKFELIWTGCTSGEINFVNLDHWYAEIRKIQNFDSHS